MTELTEHDAAHWALDCIAAQQPIIIDEFGQRLIPDKVHLWKLGGEIYFPLVRGDYMLSATTKEVLKHNEAAIRAWKEGQK